MICGSRPDAQGSTFSTPLVSAFPTTSMSDSEIQTEEDTRSMRRPLRIASVSATVWPTAAPQNMTQSGRARRTCGQIADWSLPGGV